jgi:hypothetical protein
MDDRQGEIVNQKRSQEKILQKKGVDFTASIVRNAG